MATKRPDRGAPHCSCPGRERPRPSVADHVSLQVSHATGSAAGQIAATRMRKASNDSPTRLCVMLFTLADRSGALKARIGKGTNDEAQMTSEVCSAFVLRQSVIQPSFVLRHSSFPQHH